EFEQDRPTGFDDLGELLPPQRRFRVRLTNFLVRPADEIDRRPAGGTLDRAIDVEVSQLAIDPHDDVGGRVKEGGPWITGGGDGGPHRRRRHGHRVGTSRVKQRVCTNLPSRQRTLELISTSRTLPSLHRRRAG